eukprot:1161430-Pelagomonas_calceolata.AAC.1
MHRHEALKDCLASRPAKRRHNLRKLAGLKCTSITPFQCASTKCTPTLFPVGRAPVLMFSYSKQSMTHPETQEFLNSFLTSNASRCQPASKHHYSPIPPAKHFKGQWGLRQEKLAC